MLFVFFWKVEIVRLAIRLPLLWLTWQGEIGVLDFVRNKIGVLDQMDPIFRLVLVLMSVEAINESTDDPIFWLAAHSFLIQYMLIHHRIKYIIHGSIYSGENAKTKERKKRKLKYIWNLPKGKRIMVRCNDID